MDTKKERLNYFMKINGLRYDDLIDDKSIVTNENLRVSIGRDNNKADYYLKLIATKYNISEQWLFDGVGNMMIDENKKEDPKEGFFGLGIEDKLNIIYQQNIDLIEMITKIGVRDEQYLESIAVKLGLDNESIKESEQENEIKKSSSN